MPDPYKFAARLAALHQNSNPPNGKFGFHITYSGNLPQMNNWEESWETYFTKSMRWALKLEVGVKGYDPEFDVLIPILFERLFLDFFDHSKATVDPSSPHLCTEISGMPIGNRCG